MFGMTTKYRIGLLTLALALVGAGLFAGSTRAQEAEQAQISGPIVPVPFCLNAPNGNFNLVDLNGDPASWKTVEDGGGFGDFGFGSGVTVVNVGSPNGNVAELFASSFAAYDNTWPAGSTGSGRALIRSDDFTLNGSRLVFDVVDGGFGGTIFDAVRLGYNFSVVVENLTAGFEYQQSIAGSFFGGDPGLGCGVGLAFIGIIAPETVCINLGAQGFANGDKIRVTFALQSSTAALTECDTGEFSVTVRVDNVRTCFGCPLTAIPLEGLAKLEEIVTEESAVE